MKKILAVILSLSLLITVCPFGLFTFSVSAATSGKTGDCTWKLDGTVLTISGNGEMEDYDSSYNEKQGDYCSTAPWGINITKVIIEDGVTNIGDSAFYGCENLSSVKFSDSVIDIGDYAFRRCENLSSVKIPDSVKIIGWYSFCECTSLTSINIPNGVTSIREGAFNSCTSLTSINIPNSVTHIDMMVFSGCTNLISITIPDSVTQIGPYAFSNTAYYNDSSKWENGVLYIGKHLIEANSTVPSDYAIKDGTLTIAAEAFYDCKEFTSIQIPGSVTKIGWGLFYGCTSLTSVTFGNGIASIEGSAFYDCTSLASFTIPDSVTSITSDAFYNTAYYNDSSNWENGVLYIGKHLIKAKTTISGDYVIKDGTLTIAEHAFEECKNLASITIPDSVTSIGEDAFYGCIRLASIFAPEVVMNIERHAFDKTAYYYISSNWENDVLYIGRHLIKAKTTISGDYVIKDGTLTIAEYAFEDCTSLTSIVIPDSVTSISDVAFSGCISLTSISIPDSVVTIGVSAFSGCTSLKSITIPNSVMNIKMYAFSECILLEKVYYRGSIEDRQKILIDIDENGAFLKANWIYDYTFLNNIASSTVSRVEDQDKGYIIKVVGSKADSKVYDSGTPTIKPNTRYYITFDAKGASKGNYLNFGVGNVSNTASMFFMGKEEKSGICRLFINGVEKSITTDFTNVTTAWQSYGIVFDTGSESFLEENKISSQNVLENTSYIFFGAKNSTVYFDNIKITEIGSINAPLPENGANAKHSIRYESNGDKYQSAGLRFRATISAQDKLNADEIGYVIVPAEFVVGDSDWYDIKLGINSVAKTGTWYVKNKKDIVYSSDSTSFNYQLILTGLSNQSGKNIYNSRFVTVAYVKKGNTYTYYSLGEMSYQQVKAEYDIRGIQ